MIKDNIVKPGAFIEFREVFGKNREQGLVVAVEEEWFLFLVGWTTYGYEGRTRIVSISFKTLESKSIITKRIC